MGNAPAAETWGGMGVGPVDIIVADGYILGHLFYKVLLFAFTRMNPVCKASSGVRQARSYTRWKVFVLADSRTARHMAALRSPSLSEALGLARPFTRSRKLSARMRSPPACPSSSISTRICSTFSERWWMMRSSIGARSNSSVASYPTTVAPRLYAERRDRRFWL